MPLVAKIRGLWKREKQVKSGLVKRENYEEKATNSFVGCDCLSVQVNFAYLARQYPG